MMLAETQITTNSLEEFIIAADSLFTKIKPRQSGATVIALSGELGVGKTTLVKRLAELLGNTVPVTSPTFTVAQFYRKISDPVWQQLIHIDAYRLETYEDLLNIQFEDYQKDNTNIICIEWPELVSFEDFDYKVSIEHGDTNEKRVLNFLSKASPSATPKDTKQS